MKPARNRLIHTKLRRRLPECTRGRVQRPIPGASARKILPAISAMKILTSGPAPAIRTSCCHVPPSPANVPFRVMDSGPFSASVIPPMGKRMMDLTGTPARTAMKTCPNSWSSTDTKTRATNANPRQGPLGPSPTDCVTQMNNSKARNVRCTRSSTPKTLPADMDQLFNFRRARQKFCLDYYFIHLNDCALAPRVRHRWFCHEGNCRQIS